MLLLLIYCDIVATSIDNSYVPLGYLHTSSSILPSPVLPPHSSKNMSEYRKKRSNIRSNEHKKKRILSISRRYEFNSDLFSISVDGSHEDLELHKGIFLLPPKISLLI